MTTLAVFGGTFDPPHVGHQMLCMYALETTPIDGIVVVPSVRHAFGKGVASYEDRLAMARLAMAPLGERVTVSDVERGMPGAPVYTLDVLEALAAERPDVSWRLLIGTDILGETSRWHRWDEVVRLAPPLVVARGSGAAVAIPDVSSTEARALAASDPQDLRLGELLPASVLAYIHSRELYR